mgnify:CR=1 FL=1
MNKIVNSVCGGDVNETLKKLYSAKHTASLRLLMGFDANTPVEIVKYRKDLYDGA